MKEQSGNKKPVNTDTICYVYMWNVGEGKDEKRIKCCKLLPHLLENLTRFPSHMQPLSITITRDGQQMTRHTKSNLRLNCVMYNLAQAPPNSIYEWRSLWHIWMW